MSALMAQVVFSEVEDRKSIAETESVAWSVVEEKRDRATVRLTPTAAGASATEDASPVSPSAPHLEFAHMATPPPDLDSPDFDAWLDTAPEAAIRAVLAEQEPQLKIIEFQIAEEERYRTLAKDWTPAQAMEEMAKITSELASEEQYLADLREALRPHGLIPADMATPRPSPQVKLSPLAGNISPRSNQQSLGAGTPRAKISSSVGILPSIPIPTPRGVSPKVKKDPSVQTPRRMGPDPPDGDIQQRTKTEPQNNYNTWDSDSSSSVSGNSSSQDSAESEDLAIVSPPVETPRSIPRLSPEVAKARETNSGCELLQEQLRQERTVRRDKGSARAQSYNDLGQLASLVPSLNMTRMESEVKSPVLDRCLTEQLMMEQLTRADKQFAKSASLSALGDVEQLIKEVRRRVSMSKTPIPRQVPGSPTPASPTSLGKEVSTPDTSPVQSPPPDQGIAPASPRGQRARGLYGPGT